jgi:hypothetical protein
MRAQSPSFEGWDAFRFSATISNAATATARQAATRWPQHEQLAAQHPPRPAGLDKLAANWTLGDARVRVPALR